MGEVYQTCLNIVAAGRGTLLSTPLTASWVGMFIFDITISETQRHGS